MKGFGGFFDSIGETTNKAGFKSAKTRKKERKPEYDIKRKKAKDAIKAEKRGSDARKEKRFAASKTKKQRWQGLIA